MQKKIGNCLAAVVAALMLFTTVCPTALAAERQPDTATNEKDHITFSGVSLLEPGKSMEYEMIGPDGSKAIVGITRVENQTRAAGKVWQVWYTWLANHVEFYMTVENNRVTSVYDYSISLVGSTYEDASLTKTSTYGKLTFKQVSPGGFGAATCWLKGTVTGEDDEIIVDWQM